jgi:hypothetical protein
MKLPQIQGGPNSDVFGVCLFLESALMFGRRGHYNPKGRESAEGSTLPSAQPQIVDPYLPYRAVSVALPRLFMCTMKPTIAALD